MRRTKLIVVTSAAAMILCLLACGGADAAPLWLIQKKPLVEKAAEGTEVAKMELTTGKQAEAITFESTATGGAKLVGLCTGSKSVGKQILENTEDVATGDATSVALTGCKMDEPVACKIKEEITTAELTSELLDEGTSEVESVTTPVSGTFLTLAITNCPAEGNYVLKGAVCTGELEVATEAVSKLWEFNTALEVCKLKVGANAAFVKGALEAELSGPKKGATWVADF